MVIVDEAFRDAVPGERHSVASTCAPGLVVVRSLTKLWSIPGVRAGYVLAEPDVIARLRALQPPWSVSTIALAAMQACSTEDARVEAAARAERITRERGTLVVGLSELGIDVAGSPQAPFVLARVGAGAHDRLRTAGYAVRRCDTFPGLDDSWIRIAVRSTDVTAKLLFELG
jgi:cobyrinic acid a,c-diamide synthase